MRLAFESRTVALVEQPVIVDVSQKTRQCHAVLGFEILLGRQERLRLAPSDRAERDQVNLGTSKSQEIDPGHEKRSGERNFATCSLPQLVSRLLG